MAGEYGIATGISQGFQAINQGMMNAESIQSSREQRRQNAEKTTVYLQTAQVQQDTSKVQLQALQLKLQEMEKVKAQEDAFNAFNAYEETGDTKYINLAASKNPLLKTIYDNHSVVSTSSVKDLSEDKLSDLGYDHTKYVRPIVVTKTDGTQEIQDLVGTYAASGYLKEMRKNKLDDLVLRVKENQMKAAEAETGVTVAKGELSTSLVNELNAKVKAGEMTTEEAWTMLNNKTSGKSEMKPFDIQTAEYFGKLKTKINNGVATPEETATYNSWLTKEGGSSVAANEKISIDVSKLENIGVNLADPKFSLDKVDPKDKVLVNSAIRDLEETPGGKKLVNNVSKKLGDGLGAVQAASTKIADLATKENVETAVVKNQIDAVKQYVPEALRDISEEDLKDVNFRQAFLSVTATMLKLQSGLTVSEAEAQRFAGSMGTLNKNTKVNMSGLKNKVDEIIGDYEANKTLEPTLYNAKYRTPIQGLKNVSKQLDTYLGGKPSIKVGAIIENPTTGERMKFDGKGWVKQ